MPGLEAASREERSPEAAEAGGLLFWLHDCPPRCCGKLRHMMQPGICPL